MHSSAHFSKTHAGACQEKGGLTEQSPVRVPMSSHREKPHGGCLCGQENSRKSGRSLEMPPSRFHMCANHKMNYPNTSRK